MLIYEFIEKKEEQKEDNTNKAVMSRQRQREIFKSFHLSPRSVSNKLGMSIFPSTSRKNNLRGTQLSMNVQSSINSARIPPINGLSVYNTNFKKTDKIFTTLKNSVSTNPSRTIIFSSKTSW